MPHLFEEFLEIAPVLLQHAGEEVHVVGMVENYVDARCKVLVWKINVGGLLNPEPLLENLVQCFMLKR